MNRSPSVTITLAVTMALGGGNRQACADPPDDEIKAAIWGSLVHTRVDIELHDRPSDEAFRMLGDAIGWTILIGAAQSDPPHSARSIEIGTKNRLSVAATRELRIYPVTDLMHEASVPGQRRKPRDAIGLNGVSMVVGLIEPDAWDWGQPIPQPDYDTSGLEGFSLKKCDAQANAITSRALDDNEPQPK